ncbi:cobyrinate a,c-diamide synthase [Microbaculum marinum]|uniref:Hydrogenobyrinate a,c-diamide synthase n=1 Tax=Microbaculum marinum TaxID=1764581 RepID=A0AAW9RXG1_9HYPH
MSSASSGAKGLIVAAPRSGSGKTTVTLALIAAMRRRRLTVKTAKSGPDYIDPAFHAAASGRPGINLDSWAMPPELVEALVGEAAAGADLLVIESSMGLFDGIAGEPGRRGAGADLAARLGLPVLLVMDVSGQSQSAAAVAHGFATLDPAVRIGGVIPNRVASERHLTQVADAMERIGMPVAGALMRDQTVALPERHLGLVQAREHGDLEALLERLADLGENQLNLDRILDLAAPVDARAGAAGAPLRPPGQRIALAEDAAFTFVYPHLVNGWRRDGAEIVPFSPLADEAPPPDCDVCWLPGGYPELHAGALAAATNFRDGLTRFAERRPVHGECGGFMVLGQGIEDADGHTHAMTGLLGHATSFARRKMNLGYRQARLLADCPAGSAGTVLRGHEFHYATVTDPGGDDPLAEIADGTGKALGLSGGRRGLVSGTFFHAIARAG